jgi:hypothetical protein
MTIEIEHVEEEIEEPPIEPGKTLIYVEYFDGSNEAFVIKTEEVDSLVEDLLKAAEEGKGPRLQWYKDDDEDAWKWMFRFDQNVKAMRFFSSKEED